jgi:hypothetical protein
VRQAAWEPTTVASAEVVLTYVKLALSHCARLQLFNSESFVSSGVSVGLSNSKR